MLVVVMFILMHVYRLLSSTIAYVCSIASSWLHAYLVVFLLCSCMVFIYDASGHAVLMCSVILIPCSLGLMLHCGYAR